MKLISNGNENENSMADCYEAEGEFYFIFFLKNPDFSLQGVKGFRVE